MNIDDVLIKVGMGRYQFTGFILFGLLTMYSSVSPMMYVFTADDLKYRCEIPGCDAPNSADQIYDQEWLRFTTPYRDDTGLPHKCQRYSVKSHRDNETLRCINDEFDENNTISCHDRWVFEDSENTIGKEFGLMCKENKWKLSMVGSVNNFGQFIGIPISGIIADKFGRKFAVIFCASVSAALSIVQSFSNSYLMFVVFELLSSTVSSGIYSITFVLAMEMMLPNNRVLYLSIMETFYPVGAIFVALIAKRVKDWRLLLQISNILGILFLLYFWLIEESMRWLLIQGKYDKVVNILKKIASINKISFPHFPTNTDLEIKNDDGNENNVKYSNVLMDLIGSPTILWRMIKCSFLWISVTLVYYGLNVNATSIEGDKYLNFILVSLVEIPACFLNWLIMEGMPRRIALSCIFVVSGTTCVMHSIISDKLFLVKLLVFLVSKLAISVAFIIIYLLTAEIFPTHMRTSLLSICSMIGRFGSMLAPQTTLLNEYFGQYMAMSVFAVTAFMAAVITMTLPESKNIKLPDTIDEAKRIGINKEYSA